MDFEEFHTLLGHQGKYVKCGGKDFPYKKRRDKQFYTFDQALSWLASSTLENEQSVGWWLPPNYIVVDVDEGGTASSKIAKHLSISTLKIKTRKGVHFVFTVPDSSKFTQLVGQTLPIGFNADYRVGDKGYILLPFGPKALSYKRKFINSTPPAPLPLEFTIWKGWKKSLHLQLEGGRNNALFTHLCEYKGRGATAEQLLALAPLINRYVFYDPWPDDTEALEEARKVINKDDISMRGDQNPYLRHTLKGIPKGIDQDAIVQKFVEDSTTIVLNNGDTLLSYVNGVYIDDNGITAEAQIRSLVQHPDFLKHSYMSDMLKYLARSKEIQQPNERSLNTHTSLINFKNGMWHIKNKILLPHDSSYLSTVQIPRDCPTVAFSSIQSQPRDPDSNFRVGLYNTTVYRLLNEHYSLDTDTIRVILEFMAYCMTIQNGLKTTILLLGPSGTGKTTLLKVFTSLVGEDNVSTVSMEALNDRFSLDLIKNKALNACGENSSKPLEEIANFKLVTGDDMGQTEAKYKRAQKTKFFAKFIFCYNTLPAQKGELSDAFFKRLRILSLLKKVKFNDKMVKNFHSPESVEEITPYLLDMLPLKEISDTPQSRRSVESMRRDSDSVYAFLKACCVRGNPKELSISTRELKDRYSQYCLSTLGEAPLNKKEFNKKLVDYGLVTKKETGTGRHIYRGIDLKPQKSAKKGKVISVNFR